MRGDSCVACAGRIVMQAKESAARNLARQLSSRSRYPVMYRLIVGLSLCAACLERLPVIGDEICEQCGREYSADRLCQDCHKITGETIQNNRSLLRYNEWGKDLLGTYKYRGEERLAAFYAKLLTMVVYRYHAETSFDCIATVPLHEQRLQERGFNQVDLLAKRLGADIGVPVRSLLLRTKRTAKLSQQAGRSARVESMDGAFSWAGEGLGQAEEGSYRILLLDDIYTTGSTLRSCAKTIREHAGPHSHIYSITIYR
ncbi:double zinc ribbon domain-containing protein [Brevibacillus choshinensis]|uniref:ComF family protein n=1 Tax=Brevibacillus choshinensis TaxID=54911 RepID=UPI002E21C430|nr:double zinc ribbon domain-containing protein [Brevibacillus choshinensis]